MIESILGWLTGAAPNRAEGSRDGVRLALTALLVEAAASDNHFDEREREVIRQLLDPNHQRAAFLEQRVELVEMLWEVAYADGMLDQYEDSLLRRVRGLIYVPDRERGMARQRVLGRLELDATV